MQNAAKICNKLRDFFRGLMLLSGASFAVCVIKRFAFSFCYFLYSCLLFFSHKNIRSYFNLMSIYFAHCQSHLPTLFIIYYLFSLLYCKYKQFKVQCSTSSSSSLKGLVNCCLNEMNSFCSLLSAPILPNRYYSILSIFNNNFHTVASLN